MSSLVDDGFSHREASESVHNLENVENKDDVCLFLNNEDTLTDKSTTLVTDVWFTL